MLKFELITPEKTAVSEEVYEATLPSVDGQITILPGHMPLVTLLKPGVISIRRQKNDSDEKLEHLATSGGFVEIDHNMVKVMADSAEQADEIDDQKIAEAWAEAKRMASEARDDVARTDATAQLEMALARERVKNLKRRHGRQTTTPENIQ
jgi:F-type H+-transporting ATPase subunit epsilon